MYIPRCKICKTNIALGRHADTCEEYACYRGWIRYLRTKKQYTREKAEKELKDIRALIRKANNLQKRAIKLHEFLRVQRTVDTSQRRRRLVITQS